MSPASPKRKLKAHLPSLPSVADQPSDLGPAHEIHLREILSKVGNVRQQVGCPGCTFWWGGCRGGVPAFWVPHQPWVGGVWAVWLAQDVWSMEGKGGNTVSLWKEQGFVEVSQT